MDFLETFASRNVQFAKTGFNADLKMLPSRRTMIIGCVDPRVDPMDVLKLEPGEAAVIRNVGGRVNPALLETMVILGTVSRAAGEAVGAGWNLVVLQHTDCGINGCYHHAPKLLSKYMGVSDDKLDDLAITDPYKAVAIDVAALNANPNLPGGFTVTGLVYDVKTGLLETVVPPTVLRLN
ncbi:carbonic anhydrase [Caballeronia novacaledonica]|uniref:Carbonic anhydrase n=1 Tax=Caballeronia novacaledonica TaxID=1544861 RepID=A0AA37IHS7_9BURK|nr:carbonic anhydrase [Caballeronia novacaledonica]GJH29995.1 carbonic anhydrase [Caballeronia novacaledonica]